MIKCLIVLPVLLLIAACQHDYQRPNVDYKPLNEMTVNERVVSAGFKVGSPIYIRIFKMERILELWIQKGNGQYELFQTYPICTFSGKLGPKTRQGDRQSPEGFYEVRMNQLNPNSAYHLSFDLGYPNNFDRRHGYTGDYLMVHGGCQSVGCYAMDDAQIEEIYAIVETALTHGEPFVPVHIFPFKMTQLNLFAHQDNRWSYFWQSLLPAYNEFEYSHVPPKIKVVKGHYLIEK